jgi:hypothetical protein
MARASGDDRATLKDSERHRQTVLPGHHELTGPAGRESLTKPGMLAVGAGQAVIDVDWLGLDSQTEQPSR